MSTTADAVASEEQTAGDTIAENGVNSKASSKKKAAKDGTKILSAGQAKFMRELLKHPAKDENGEIIEGVYEVAQKLPNKIFKDPKTAASMSQSVQTFLKKKQVIAAVSKGSQNKPARVRVLTMDFVQAPERKVSKKQGTVVVAGREAGRKPGRPKKTDVVQSTQSRMQMIVALHNDLEGLKAKYPIELINEFISWK